MRAANLASGQGVSFSDVGAPRVRPRGTGRHHHLDAADPPNTSSPAATAMNSPIDIEMGDMRHVRRNLFQFGSRLQQQENNTGTQSAIQHQRERLNRRLQSDSLSHLLDSSDDEFSSDNIDNSPRAPVDPGSDVDDELDADISQHSKNAKRDLDTQTDLLTGAIVEPDNTGNHDFVTSSTTAAINVPNSRNLPSISALRTTQDPIGQRSAPCRVRMSLPLNRPTTEGTPLGLPKLTKAYRLLLSQIHVDANLRNPVRINKNQNPAEPGGGDQGSQRIPLQSLLKNPDWRWVIEIDPQHRKDDHFTFSLVGTRTPTANQSDTRPGSSSRPSAFDFAPAVVGRFHSLSQTGKLDPGTLYRFPINLESLVPPTSFQTDPTSTTSLSHAEKTTGPGGCCNQWHMLRAGGVQALSTAATFGTKPFVEAAARQLLEARGYDSTTASTVAGVIGGVYVGAIHTLIGKTVSGVMNALLGVNTYSLHEDRNKFLHEIFTIDLTVMLAFILAYAARGKIMGGENENPWLDAVSKTVASTVGGFVQGMITDVMKQSMTSDYTTNVAATNEKPLGKLVAETFKDNAAAMFKTAESASHDYFGKIGGSTAGMTLSATVKTPDPVGEGALGMYFYLFCWFVGIHIGAEIGSVLDSGEAAPRPDPGEHQSQSVSPETPGRHTPVSNSSLAAIARTSSIAAVTWHDPEEDQSQPDHPTVGPATSSGAASPSVV